MVVKEKKMKVKFAHHIFIVIWSLIAGGSIFTVSYSFMDTIVYPKWIITSLLFVYSSLFFLPFLYFTYRQIEWKTFYKDICRTTNIIIFIENLVVIAQFLGIDLIYYNCQAGTFNNVAGLAACLVVTFPMGFIFINEMSSFERILFLISKCLYVLVLAFCGSRIGCVCIIVTLFLIFSRNLRYKRLYALFIGITCLIISACFIKTASTHGRFFILSRTIDLIMQHPIIGWGHEGFAKEYMNIQADYFSAHPDSPYELLADNIHHPLNEFLLIATNYGIPVVLLLTLACIASFYHYSTHKTLCGREGGLMLLNIIVLAFFSYPFSYPFTWLLLGVSLILILFISIKAFIKKRIVSIALISSWGICLVLVFMLTNQLDRQLCWKMTSRTVTSNTYKETKRKYEELYTNMRKDPYFLFDYASKAYDANDFSLAMKLSKEAECHISDYELTLLIADSYQSLEDWENAIVAYQKAHYMCPAKITPLYEIYSIYSSRNDSVNCKKIYLQIMQKDIKVNSLLVKTMLNDIKRDFIRYNSINQKKLHYEKN